MKDKKSYFPKSSVSYFPKSEESDALIESLIRVANNSVYGKFHTQPKEGGCPICEWEKENKK